VTVVDNEALASALRQVIKGLQETVAVLEGNVPGRDKRSREIAVAKEFDVPASRGLSRAEASHVFRKHGFDPRGFGSWVRHGYITRKGDRRSLSKDGREWLQRAEAEMTQHTGHSGTDSGS
jgi:hypothetical protein